MAKVMCVMSEATLHMSAGSVVLHDLEDLK